MKITAMSCITVCCMLLSALAARAADPAQTPQGIIKLDSIAGEYTPVRFDHPKHAAIAGDCGICHHQHGAGASLSCRECHTIAASSFKSSTKANFTACRNCHDASDPAVPGMPGLKVAYHRQCFQCHRGMGEVGNSPQGCILTCHDKRNRQAKQDVKSVR